MSESPKVDSPLVRERLLLSLLDRRAAVIAASIGTVALAFTAAYLTHADWPYVWLAADITLIVARWIIIVRSEGLATTRLERRAAALMLLGAIWSLLLGLAICACLVTGEPALIALSAAMGAGAASAITSRNAATPRQAMLCIALILVPMAAGAAFSPHRGMIVLTVIALCWLVGFAAMVGQNQMIVLRLIEAELKARSMAETDPLTGLYNRKYLADHLARMAAQGITAEGYSLLCLDLDGFKAVNDTHGHLVGDTLLQAAAERIRGAVRPEDIVFRMGGDEFLILLHEPDSGECERVAARLIAIISKPYELPDGVRVMIGTSVGSACTPSSSLPSEIVLHAADMALYRAKAAGKGVHMRAAA